MCSTSLSISLNPTYFFCPWSCVGRRPPGPAALQRSSPALAHHLASRSQAVQGVGRRGLLEGARGGVGGKRQDPPASCPRARGSAHAAGRFIATPECHSRLLSHGLWFQRLPTPPQPAPHALCLSFPLQGVLPSLVMVANPTLQVGAWCRWWADVSEQRACGFAAGRPSCRGAPTVLDVGASHKACQALSRPINSFATLHRHLTTVRANNGTWAAWPSTVALVNDFHLATVTFPLPRALRQFSFSTCPLRSTSCTSG